MLIAPCLAAAVILVAAPADSGVAPEQTVHLRDGSTLRGQVLMLDSGAIVLVRTADGERLVPAGDVLRIEGEASGPPLPAPSPTATPPPRQPDPDPNANDVRRPSSPTLSAPARTSDALVSGIFFTGVMGVQFPQGPDMRDHIGPGTAGSLQVGWRFHEFASVETGFDFAFGEEQARETTGATFVRVFNLDFRLHVPLRTARITPNVSAGLGFSGLSYQTDLLETDYYGYSPALGAGVQVHARKRLFVTADLRWLFTRYTSVTYTTAQTGMESEESVQLQGDVVQFVAGVGAQF